MRDHPAGVYVLVAPVVAKPPTSLSAKRSTTSRGVLGTLRAVYTRLPNDRVAGAVGPHQHAVSVRAFSERRSSTAGETAAASWYLQPNLITRRLGVRLAERREGQDCQAAEVAGCLRTPRLIRAHRWVNHWPAPVRSPASRARVGSPPPLAAITDVIRSGTNRRLSCRHKAPDTWRFCSLGGIFQKPLTCACSRRRSRVPSSTARCSTRSCSWGQLSSSRAGTEYGRGVAR